MHACIHPVSGLTHHCAKMPLHGAATQGQATSTAYLVPEDLPVPHCSAAVDQLLRTASQQQGQQQWAAALDAYADAARAWTQAHGPPPAELRVFFGVARGRVYEHAKRDEKALHAFIEAHSAARDLPASHLDRALVHSLVAGVYARHGDTHTALEHYRRALAVRREVLGPNHPDVAATMCNIGVCELSAGDPVGAVTTLAQAWSNCKQSLGSSHQRTVHILSNLTRAQAELERQHAPVHKRARASKRKAAAKAVRTAALRDEAQ